MRSSILQVLAPASLLLSGSLAAAKSILFTGATIIGFDNATESLQITRDGSLLVTNDRIVGIYPRPPPVTSDTETVDARGKIISPGFIDTHRHGWQTGFKTIASNTSLVEYFGRYGEFAVAGLLTPEDVYIGQLAGLYEALAAGVTTTLDHAHHTWSNATAEAGLQASIDSGARVFWSYAFHNVTNYTTTEQIAHFRALATKGSYKGTRTSLGLAYDSFGPDPNVAEVNKLLGLVK